MLSLYLFVWTDPIAIRAKTGALMLMMFGLVLSSSTADAHHGWAAAPSAIRAKAGTADAHGAPAWMAAYAWVMLGLSGKHSQMPWIDGSRLKQKLAADAHDARVGLGWPDRNQATNWPS